MVVVRPIRRLAGWGLFSGCCAAYKKASRLGSRCWVLPYLQLAHFVGQGRLEAREHTVLKRARQTCQEGGEFKRERGLGIGQKAYFISMHFFYVCA